jgi:hypothetical protein
MIENEPILVTHDFPDDVPVAVVADCSPSPAHEAGIALIEEGITIARNGDAAAGMAKIAEGQAMLEQLASVPPPVSVRPLDAEELAVKEADRIDGEATVAAAESAAADRAALTEKLTAGKATSAETQAALAQLLGGTAPASTT